VRFTRNVLLAHIVLMSLNEGDVKPKVALTANHLLPWPHLQS